MINMTVIFFVILGVGVQSFFTFKQMKNFTYELNILKKKGDVAIGKYKGGFFKGCIIIFSLNKNRVIESGKIMRGVTVFAKVEEFSQFNGVEIFNLEKILSQGKIEYSVKKSLMNMLSNLSIKS